MTYEEARIVLLRFLPEGDLRYLNNQVAIRFANSVYAFAAETERLIERSKNIDKEVMAKCQAYESMCKRAVDSLKEKNNFLYLRMKDLDAECSRLTIALKGVKKVKA